MFALQAAKLKWLQSEETLPFWSAMVLENRAAYPDYKLPMQLVKVLARNEPDAEAEDGVAERDEIRDPDAVFYDCELYLCKFHEDDEMFNWEEAAEKIMNKKFVPEPGQGNRAFHMDLAQSQLLFAPGELKLTSAMKIYARCRDEVKRVFQACSEEVGNLE